MPEQSWQGEVCSRCVRKAAGTWDIMWAGLETRATGVDMVEGLRIALDNNTTTRVFSCFNTFVLKARSNVCKSCSPASHVLLKCRNTNKEALDRCLQQVNSTCSFTFAGLFCGSGFSPIELYQQAEINS